jgi:hypothetical protein
MPLFQDAAPKGETDLFKAVGAGSGRVDFSGASDARGLLHAIADASARHRINVLGYEHGNEHPELTEHVGGGSVSSVPDLTAQEEYAIAAIRTFEMAHDRAPTVEEVQHIREQVAAKFRDRLGDLKEATTPLQKATPATESLSKGIARAADGEVTDQQRKRLAAAAVGAFEDERGRQPDDGEREELERMIDEALAEAAGSVSGWKGFGWTGAGR